MGSSICIGVSISLASILCYLGMLLSGSINIAVFYVEPEFDRYILAAREIIYML